MKKRERIEELEARMDTVELALNIGPMPEPAAPSQPDVSSMFTTAEQLDRIVEQELAAPVPEQPARTYTNAEVAARLAENRAEIDAADLAETQRDAEQPAYPWAEGADLTGGRVTRSGDNIGTVLGYDPNGICDWVVAWDGDTHPCNRYGCDTATLRPAPHVWAVGDTARVVSTAATDACPDASEYSMLRDEYVGRNSRVGPVFDDNTVGLNDDFVWHLADLLYIPPVAAPANSATANVQATGETPILRERIEHWLREIERVNEGPLQTADAVRAALDEAQREASIAALQACGIEVQDDNR